MNHRKGSYGQDLGKTLPKPVRRHYLPHRVAALGKQGCRGPTPVCGRGVWEGACALEVPHIRVDPPSSVRVLLALPHAPH